ncbi:MAG: mechanosensitive ion channel domain-containing protein [Candidatus Zixiibacteriota bacterium]
MELNDHYAGLLNLINEILDFKLFEINQIPVTTSSIVFFVIVIMSFYIISRLLNRLILKRILSKFNIDKSIQFTLRRMIHYLIMITGTVLAFQFVGIDLAGLAVIFGLLSVGIGFGLQNVTSNFISGLILLFERPIKVGDRVTVGDIEGDVISIDIRATTVNTLNNIAIIVPNSEFVSSKVTNWSYGDPKIRLNIEVGVSYGSDLDAVIKALYEVAVEHQDVLKVPKPSVLLAGFGDSSWNMLLRIWLRNSERYYLIRSEINCAIVRKFRKCGIEIPFPQRDLHVRSPLPVPILSDNKAGN